MRYHYAILPLDLGAEDDGGQQPEGHPAPADRRQNYPLRGQGRRRQNQFRGILQHCRQHGCTQENGCRCLKKLDIFQRVRYTVPVPVHRHIFAHFSGQLPFIVSYILLI